MATKSLFTDDASVVSQLLLPVDIGYICNSNMMELALQVK